MLNIIRIITIISITYQNFREVKQAVTFNLNSIQANDAKKCNTLTQYFIFFNLF